MSQVPCPTVLIGTNALLLAGLARILRDSNFKVLESAASVEALNLAAIEPQVLGSDAVTLLIIDAGEDFKTARRQVQSLKKRFPASRIAVLTDENSPHSVTELLRAGANACLASHSTCETFVKSLELVVLGETILPAKFIAAILGNKDAAYAEELDNDHSGEDPGEPATSLDREEGDDPDQMLPGSEEPAAHAAHHDAGIPRLSARQEAILRYLIEGDSNKTIARKISISEATVKVHVKSILRKIHVHNRTQAAIWALNRRPDSLMQAAELREANVGAIEGSFKRGRGTTPG